MYRLINYTETNENGSCLHRSQGGVIQIYMPKVIDDYNDNMGVFIFSDMRILYCNSTVIELNFCWMKFF